MAKINKSMRIPELNLRPPISAAVSLSEDMQQTLALLTMYSDNRRVLVRGSKSGALNTVSPNIANILHFVGSGANDTQSGVDIPCTEIMVMGHPDNAGEIWVRSGVTATVNNSWPLAAYDVVVFTLDNLNQLKMLIVRDGEKVIIAYTR